MHDHTPLWERLIHVFALVCMAIGAFALVAVLVLAMGIGL